MKTFHKSKLSYDQYGLYYDVTDDQNSEKSMRIVFLCDERANQIGAKPVIYDQQNGKLVFEWKTPYACPPLPSHCSFLDPEKNHFFDISPLRKTDGTAYLAMDLSYMTENGGDGSSSINERQVYANACGELYPTNQNTFDCPYGSAVCEPSKNLSYGTATYMNLQMDESGKHLQLIYRDGSDCEDHPGGFLIGRDTFTPFLIG